MIISPASYLLQTIFSVTISKWVTLRLRALPVAGEHRGSVGFGLRGYRAGGVAGEAALRDHPGQEGLVLAHHTGDAHGIICEGRHGCYFYVLERGKWKPKVPLTLFIILVGAAESVLRRLA